MAQRHMCPSMGVLRRSLTADAPSISKTSLRALSGSARRLEEQPSNAAPSGPAAATPSTRRNRSEAALRQITNLQNRRTQPSSPAQGNLIRRTAVGSSSTGLEAGDTRAVGPRMARFSARPTTTHDASPPEGQMVRAPGALRVNRNATVGGMRGPNLGGRSAGRGGPKGDKGPGGREQGPKKRGPKTGNAEKTQPISLADMDVAESLSDGMVHQLLRLQRLEWDRFKYEPKYTQGSFAAQELIHEGRELFRGEAPPVKIWGKLEKRIGVVGMFGAEAHLKVTRVPDGDDAAFGQEDMEIPEAEATGEGKKEATVQ